MRKISQVAGIATLFLAGLCAYGQNTYFNGGLTIEGGINYGGTDTGSGNSFVITLPASAASIGAYRVGTLYSFKASHANTGAATLAIGGLSATTIKKQGNTADLASGDIASGSIILVQYDGTYFEIQSNVANAATGGGGSGTVTSFSVTSTPAWLSSSVSTASTTPALTLSSATGQTAHQVLGTGSGSTFGPVTLAAGDLPTTVVLESQANTYTTGLQNFSAATAEMPISAGYAPTTSGLFGYNSTTNAFVVGVNGTTGIEAYYTGTQPTTGDCVQWSSSPGKLADTGAACGGAGGAAYLTGNSNPTYSATLAIPITNATASVTLTGNIAFTLAAGADGQGITLVFIQGTTVYSINPPANVHGFMGTTGMVASKANAQHFRYVSSLSEWVADSSGVINQ